MNGGLLRKIRVAILVAISATLPTKWVNLNSFFIILLVIVWLVDLTISKRRIKFNWILLLSFTSFYLLTFFSLFYTNNLDPLFSKLEIRLVILVFPLILLGSSDIDASILKLILKTFLVSCTIISLLCFVYTFGSNYIGGNVYRFSNNWLFSSENLVDRFGFDPNYLSLHSIFCIFIALFLFSEGELRSWISLLLIAFLGIFQLLLASRVGILTFVVLSTLTILYEAYLRRRLLNGIIYVILFIGVVLGIGINSQTTKDKFDALFNRNIHKYNEPFRVNRRVIQWNSAVQVFMKSPLLGVGTGDMQDELQKIYFDKKFNEGYEIQYNPHNLFLDSAASLGLLGLISNLLLFGISFYRSLSVKNILYLQFLLLFFSFSLVESTFSVQKGVVFFFFFNTLFYSSLKRKQQLTN